MADFYIKRGDTKEPIAATLSDENGAVDVTGAAVKFLMRRKTTGAVKVNSAGQIVDGAAGTVRYEWSAEDTDTEGEYQAEWQVTFADARVQTFPNDSYIEVKVVKDIGD